MVEVLLVQFGIALTAIALAGAVANRLSLSVIPAYIVVGVLVGPNEPSSVAGVPLTLVEHGELIEVLAEVGVVLLLFFLGLEFSITTLLNERRRIATAGSVDFAVNFGLGAILGLALGLSVLETVFVAGIVYISSSAVVTKSIVDNGWVTNPEGDVILGTLVFEDIVIAIYLAVLSAVVLGSGSVAEAGVTVATAFVFLGALAGAAWYGTGAIERAFDTSSDELFLLRVLGITTLIAGVALWLGLSEAVAAFFVGTAFSNTDLVERIEHLLGPARDLFAAVFFFAIGLTTDVTVLDEALLLLGAAVVVTTAGKLVSGSLSGRVYDLTPTRSLRVGIGLVPRGEFSLVIAALAAGSGTEPLQTLVPAFAVGYVLLMSVLGTLLIQHADRITAVATEPRATGG